MRFSKAVIKKTSYESFCKNIKICLWEGTYCFSIALNKCEFVKKSRWADMQNKLKHFLKHIRFL